MFRPFAQLATMLFIGLFLSSNVFAVYNADLGRWVTRDPIGHVDGQNLYGYGRMSPLMGSDPHGLIFPTLPYVLRNPCTAKIAECEADPYWAPLLEKARNAAQNSCGNLLENGPTCAVSAGLEACTNGCGEATVHCAATSCSVEVIVCGLCSGQSFCSALVEEYTHARQYCDQGACNNCQHWARNFDVTDCLQMELEVLSITNKCNPVPPGILQYCADPNYCECVFACKSCQAHWPPTGMPGCMNACDQINNYTCPQGTPFTFGLLVPP